MAIPRPSSPLSSSTVLLLTISWTQINNWYSVPKVHLNLVLPMPATLLTTQSAQSLHHWLASISRYADIIRTFYVCRDWLWIEQTDLGSQDILIHHVVSTHSHSFPPDLHADMLQRCTFEHSGKQLPRLWTRMKWIARRIATTVGSDLFALNGKVS